VRVPWVVVMLFAGAFSVHAQSTHIDRVDRTTNRVLKSAKPGTNNDSGVAVGTITLGLNYKLSEEISTASERGDMALDPYKISDTQLETVSWSEVNGWTVDDHIVAFATFLNSCKTIVRGTPQGRAGQPFYAALQSVCRRAVVAQPRDSAAARNFFEQNFRPMRIAPLGENNGLLTGYYEPIIAGSRVASSKFNVPIYRMPPDLNQRDTSAISDRIAIEEGALTGRNLEICWLKDPSDLFLAQMEGSARIKLEDGTVLRLNYDGQWPYTPIGRILVERNVMKKEEVSVGRIRDWMQANPEEAKDLRRQNKSFVFFRETGLAEHEEPVGAQGISLTPGRSIAVDKFIHVYGTPFFIEAKLPIESKSPTKFQRLMVSQDTGGAIIGPARADLYFGAGDGPAHVAGRIRHPGQFTMLIPREIDPVVAGERTPLPRPRPLFAKVEEQPEKTSDRSAIEQKKKKILGVSLIRRNERRAEPAATRQ
jgi:membrane-bound lytic murein transglycosylase A